MTRPGIEVADVVRQHGDAVLDRYDDRLCPEQRRAFCEKFGIREYESLEAVIADPQVHAATVATPSGLHAAVAVPVLEAGKAVLCEKPIDVTIEAVDAILAAEPLRGCESFRLLGDD